MQEKTSGYVLLYFKMVLTWQLIFQTAENALPNNIKVFRFSFIFLRLFVVFQLTTTDVS
jgi:hypothetical protein